MENTMKPGRLDNFPVHEWGGLHYVDLTDIPEPARTAFQRSLYGAQRPLVPGVKEPAYPQDWRLFLERYRRAN